MISVAEAIARQPVPGRLLRPGFLIVFILLAGLACSGPPAPIVLNGTTMGTSWTVRLADVPTGASVPALREEVEQVLEAVNAQMSTYREASDISRFNRAQPGSVQEVPAGFARVLEHSLALAEATGGAFDPTVGPLVNLWGFGPDPMRHEAPPPGDIDAALARTGWQRIDYDPESRELTQPGGLVLDFSANAKGHAVDLIADLLIERGVAGFMVDIGGDLRTHGVRPDGQHWRIAVERPMAGSREVHGIIEPGDRAVATSGSYRNFFEHQGRRFSHTIDPRTGHPVAHSTVLVTVVHPLCIEADGWATALMVLDPDEGLGFAERHGLAVLWLLEEDGEFVERMSTGFVDLLQPEVH